MSTAQGPVPLPDEGPTGLRAFGGLGRVGAEMAWHSAGWALDRSLRTTVRVARAAISPREAVGLARDAAALARDVEHLASGVGGTVEEILLRISADLLGEAPRPAPAGTGGAGAKPSSAPVQPAGSNSAGGGPERGPGGPRGGWQRTAAQEQTDARHRSLREQGEELLRLSRDVRSNHDTHPAYERILSELAPDEGRVLLLLLTHGPQPAVDVRTGGPLGLISSKLIAPGLSMIGSRAGCRYTERIPAYLNNLFRLGLVWFSRETLPDPLRYQVLEAQPDVLAAMHSVRQARIVRRSIHLTPFGEDFCRTCLPADDGAMASAPLHALPPEVAKAGSPPALGRGE